MRKLLILLVLLPLVGWGQSVTSPPTKWLTTYTYTDGFGYELREIKGGFWFEVKLDFDVPQSYSGDKFSYEGYGFGLYRTANCYIAATRLITDRRCFTHEDAWAIRNMAWELVNGGCDCPWQHRHAASVRWEYCPHCGKKLEGK